MRAVVLAGGKGTRLYPYTTVLPKPLMPVGEAPILDIVLKRLSNSGFKRVTLAVGYLSDLIKTYVGTGKKYGLKIDYSEEPRPLGTIGPLSKIKGLKTTFMVMNGDLLTDLNLKKMYKFHKKSGNLITVAVKKRKVTVDYGVIEFDNNLNLTGHKEKPGLHYFVGMGICYFEPKVLNYIPKNRKYDFPHLVKTFIKKDLPVGVYQSKDYWRDIGRWEDYLASQKEFKSKKKLILKK